MPAEMCLQPLQDAGCLRPLVEKPEFADSRCFLLADEGVEKRLRWGLLSLWWELGELKQFQSLGDF